jgi:hypothetical protein
MLQCTRPSGRAVYDPWSPAAGSAIVPECDGHEVAPDWSPGSCHHQRSENEPPCLCVPSWAAELPWEPSGLAIWLAGWNEDERLCEPECTCSRHRPGYRDPRNGPGPRLRPRHLDEWRHLNRFGPGGWAG